MGRWPVLVWKYNVSMILQSSPSLHNPPIGDWLQLYTAKNEASATKFPAYIPQLPYGASWLGPSVYDCRRSERPRWANQYSCHNCQARCYTVSPRSASEERDSSIQVAKGNTTVINRFDVFRKIKILLWRSTGARGQLPSAFDGRWHQWCSCWRLRSYCYLIDFFPRSITAQADTFLHCDHRHIWTWKSRVKQA